MGGGGCSGVWGAVGGGGGIIHLLVPSSSCDFVLVSISECFSLLSVLFGVWS